MAGGGVDRGQDSVTDGLKKIFGQISNLKLAQDAPQHMQIIDGLGQLIMQYLQQQAQKAAQAAMQAAGPQQQQQSPGGGVGGGGLPGGGLPPPQAQQIAPGGGGGMSGFGAPNPDELRRVLQGA